MNRDERDMLIVAQERLITLNKRYENTKRDYYILLFETDNAGISDYDKRFIAQTQEVIDQIQKMLDESNSVEEYKQLFD